MVSRVIFSRPEQVRSALASLSGVVEFVTAMHLAFAAFAAATPSGASSITTQRAGLIPSRWAAIRNSCGSGFLYSTSLPLT